MVYGFSDLFCNVIYHWLTNMHCYSKVTLVLMHGVIFSLSCETQLQQLALPISLKIFIWSHCWGLLHVLCRDTPGLGHFHTRPLANLRKYSFYLEALSLRGIRPHRKFVTVTLGEGCINVKTRDWHCPFLKLKQSTDKIRGRWSGAYRKMAK
jgi:hypothetical protein